jgi:hypothetical protein
MRQKSTHREALRTFTLGNSLNVIHSRSFAQGHSLKVIRSRSLSVFTAWQKENRSLDSHFIDFQSQLLKIKDWLGRTENILASHSRLLESQQLTSPHTETIKVSSRHGDGLHG